MTLLSTTTTTICIAPENNDQPASDVHSHPLESRMPASGTMERWNDCIDGGYVVLLRRFLNPRVKTRACFVSDPPALHLQMNECVFFFPRRIPLLTAPSSLARWSFTGFSVLRSAPKTPRSTLESIVPRFSDEFGLRGQECRCRRGTETVFVCVRDRDAMKASHHDHLSGHPSPSSCPSPSRQKLPACVPGTPWAQDVLPYGYHGQQTTQRVPCHRVAWSRGYRRLRPAIAEWATRFCIAPSRCFFPPIHTRRHSSAGVYPPSLARHGLPSQYTLQAVPPRLSYAVSPSLNVAPSAQAALNQLSSRSCLPIAPFPPLVLCASASLSVVGVVLASVWLLMWAGVSLSARVCGSSSLSVYGRLYRQRCICVVSLSRSSIMLQDDNVAAALPHSLLSDPCSPSTHLHFARPLVLNHPPPVPMTLSSRYSEIHFCAA
ncbi:hypothetical protein C8F01DRAFT_1275953 [Mycena amicta]|nr:hypothetical protein C8F01DRAFT_1275953 [Mycena amicta]